MSLSLQEQYDKIYKYCYFKVKNIQLADDLTQETFLKFFSQRSYISRGKPLAYLYTIAKNLCVDIYRNSEAQWFPDNYDINGITDTENIIENMETSVVVEEALKMLPKDIQELLLLRFANDLSMAEISLITGLSRFTLRRKINNGLSELKLILRKGDFT